MRDFSFDGTSSSLARVVWSIDYRDFYIYIYRYTCTVLYRRTSEHLKVAIGSGGQPQARGQSPGGGSPLRRDARELPEASEAPGRRRREGCLFGAAAGRGWGVACASPLVGRELRGCSAVCARAARTRRWRVGARVWKRALKPGFVSGQKYLSFLDLQLCGFTLQD